MTDCQCGAGHHQGAELGASEIDGDGIGEFHFLSSFPAFGLTFVVITVARV